MFLLPTWELHISKVALKQSFFEVTSISLIIHKMMTPCQKRVKQHGRGLYFTIRPINKVGNSNIRTIFTIDIIFINYS